jgi:hypothetical protein
MKPQHWTVDYYGVKYDYEAIRADLIRLGATEEEADGLTEILHLEGWGECVGDEYLSDHFTDEQLEHKILWYREFRAPDAEVL